MKILCVGLMVCDIIIKPVSEKVLKMDTQTADIIDIKIGGDACNVACNITNLGNDVSLFSAIGNDFYGKYIIDKLQKAGVCTKNVLSLGTDTSRSAVLIGEEGERCFISQKGACHNLLPSDIDDVILSNIDFLYIGSLGDLPNFEGNELEKLLKKAKTLGITTILDVTGEVNIQTFENNKKAFAYLDIFLPSIREARNMSGYDDVEQCLRFFAKQGIKIVCIKSGEKGSFTIINDEFTVIPPYKTECIDTTGAGDAFVAGFISAYVHGLNVYECCKVGNYVGAKTVSQVGAQVYLSNLKEIIKRM